MSEAHAASGTPHITNWMTLIIHGVGAESAVGKWLHRFEDLLFAAIIALFLCLIFWIASRRPQLIPKGIQNAMELVVESLNNFVLGVMGPNGRPFVPLIGTLFLYIWMMNLAGLLPGFKSPTANLNLTAGLALCVFFIVQYTGIRSFGIKGFFLHKMGSPENLMMFVIGILIFVIEIVGELVKPVSLSMRLAFNITGEDTFLAVAVQFGPLGVLLQLMAMGLGLILGTAQALVFSTLSAVFISMMLPHEEQHLVSHHVKEEETDGKH